MTDGEYSLLMLVALLSAAVVYFFALARSQKKTIAALTSATATPADAQLAQKEREIEELRQRVHVLERIAVEKENSLAREIEELRDR
jgi:cell division protein FtsB